MSVDKISSVHCHNSNVAGRKLLIRPNKEEKLKANHPITKVLYNFLEEEEGAWFLK